MVKKRSEKVDFKTYIRGNIDDVFSCMATAEGLNKWFTSEAAFNTKPGSPLIFRWKEWGADNYTGEFPGKVLAHNRPNWFSFSWRADSGTYDTTVEIDFIRAKDGTMVKLIEYGYENTPDGMQDLLKRVAGWAQVLTLLKMFVEHGIKY